MLPARTTAYLQPCDTIYNAVFKLKHKLAIENYMLDLYFDGEKMACNDENAAYLAANVYDEIPESVVKDLVFEFNIIFRISDIIFLDSKSISTTIKFKTEFRKVLR